MALRPPLPPRKSNGGGNGSRAGELPGRPAILAVLQVLLVCLAAGMAAAIASIGNGADARDWISFGVLAGAAAVAQLFVVPTTRNRSHHLAIVFVVAAALLLPPELVALVCVVQHVPDWVKQRYPAAVQSFNIAAQTLAALAAWSVGHLVLGSNQAGSSSRMALAGLCAGVAFVLVSHGLRAGMLRETRLLSLDSLLIDLVLVLSGVGVAAWWYESPWLTAIGAVPLLLVHRGLSVSRLRAEANLDGKTGLYNARHLNAALAEELQRAARFGRPLSVIVADLDLLRKINNSHGHLAGDAVLEGVAGTFDSLLRPYDVAARFGGEEFAVLLPETDFAEAMVIAERVRAAFAEERFRRSGSDEEVAATLSLGVASYPLHAADADELVHQADVALYRSKALGRNRVSGASEETRVLNRLLPADDGPRGFRPYGPNSRSPKAAGRAAAALGVVRRRLTGPRVERVRVQTEPRPAARPSEAPHPSMAEVRRANEELRRSNAYLQESSQRSRRRHVATIAALSSSMERNDSDQGRHTQRVAAIAVGIARRLGYRGEELDAIEMGALLLDIGKIGVPDSILQKRGRLNKKEWNQVREHPVISDYILSGVDLHPFVRQIARWSHERIDGQGYPDGLAGADIPLAARIATVADAFDALTSDRPYRRGRSIPAALAELRDHADTQFCPEAVAALDQLWLSEPQVLGKVHLRVLEGSDPASEPVPDSASDTATGP